MAREKKRGPKLPVQQLVILAMVRFAEPLALTSVFPYLPEMIKSFGVPKEEVAKWAGMTGAVFSVAQSLTAVPWGWASDRIGRKTTIIIGLISTMTCFIFWGASTSLHMAIAVRGIQGASNGNVGTIRTMVAEMVPQKALQPRAFSIMPMVWSIGSVFGPSFGGFFARPAEQFPGLFGQVEFFKKYPFLLPNLIACVFFIFSTVNAFLFLEETLESRKHKTDWGIELGERITRIFRGGRPSKRSALRARTRARAEARAEARGRRLSFIDDEASAPLLSSAAIRNESDLTLGASKPPTAVDDSTQLAKVAVAAVSSGAPEVLGEARLTSTHSSAQTPSIFTYQTSMALLCYTMLALHSVAYDQVLPVFLNYPYEKHDSSNTNLPFKFSGGFGLSSGSIGTIFTVNALISGFAQFAAFPPLCSRFGALRCYRYSCVLLPFVYILTPYSVLLDNERLRYAVFMLMFVLKGVFTMIVFPCVTIILTNSAPSVKVLGTLNGYATLFSGMGRAVGPAMTGAAFSWGVQQGYIITGWALLSVVAVLGAISTFFLQEGDGIEIPAQVAGGEEELEGDGFGSESGGDPVSYSYVTTDDEDDDEDDYEESLLRDVAQDDDDYYINNISRRPHSSGTATGDRSSQSRASSRHWTVASNDSPLPAPVASRFNETLVDGTVASTTTPTTTAQPKLDELREPEDPESDDSEGARAAGLGLEVVDDSTQPSPVRTRRFRSASTLSRRSREGNGAPVPLSPVAPSASNAVRDE
ncbi:major facilitator superfamily transporter [Sporothrix brasiliensis 5110]|uniref:Major facilitator superfamily transporter n=1 Tax=Sporothrix brasiliensis 5110 TaxID=1398154 RepID=A0A0C2FTF0_9PEZI|nr:major facilitator superfamily transporter [Sporothrix brasiliensis 5110]KIH94313.1 major facilitator superfamily transporter [Sporothrix brasiliensis 5110]